MKLRRTSNQKDKPVQHQKDETKPLKKNKKTTKNKKERQRMENHQHQNQQEKKPTTKNIKKHQKTNTQKTKQNNKKISKNITYEKTSAHQIRVYRQIKTTHLKIQTSPVSGWIAPSKLHFFNLTKLTSGAN